MRPGLSYFVYEVRATAPPKRKGKNLTDTPIPAETEVAEISDAEAAKLVQLKDYGITSDLTEQNFNLLYDLYLKELAKVQAAADSAKKASSGQTELKSQALTQVQAIEQDEFVPELISQVLEVVFQYLDSHPEQSPHVHSGLTGIASYVNDITKTSVEKISYGLKQDQGIDVTEPDEDDSVEDSKNICKAVRFTLTGLLNVAPLIDNDWEPPASISVKTGKNGNLLPDLPDLPKGRTAGSNLGRGAKARKVRYSWQETGSDEVKPLREGVLLAEICTTIISKGSYRIGHTELQSMFSSTDKNKVHQFSGTVDEPWELTFPTGTLRGYLPAE